MKSRLQDENSSLFKIQQQVLADKSSQQYILELDPCSKCFQTMQTPYKTSSIKDIQNEAKFTDNTSIFKLAGAHQLKSFSYSVHEAKGFKQLTKLTLYVNSKQDLDIAEMRNNWALWQKVVDLPIDLSQKNAFTATLPLPVTATNILIEYHSVNLSKPIEFTHQ